MTTSFRKRHRTLALRLERYLPMIVRRLFRRIAGEPPPPGGVKFGDLRRTKPIDEDFGFNRGLPVDRYYIEHFLQLHVQDIRGHVLEIGDDVYTRRFGGTRVKRSSVLHASPGNPKATYVADLSDAGHLPEEEFDCVILTQTLQFIYDTAAAVRTLRRILKPGGVLIVTVPGISRLDLGEWPSYWSFSGSSLSRLLAEGMGAEPSVRVYGNTLSALAAIEGLATHELKPAELDEVHPAYPVLVAARVSKPHVIGT